MAFRINLRIVHMPAPTQTWWLTIWTSLTGRKLYPETVYCESRCYVPLVGRMRKRMQRRKHSLDKTKVPGLSACMGWVNIKWKQPRAWKGELASQISR